APRSLLLFSFYYHTPPPDLHSFPTRRSSDLLLPGPDAHGTGGAGGGEADALRGGQPRLGEPDAALAPADGRHRRRRPVGGHGGRSEEHTSELQSRENLVCRLLLEKKKKNKLK